jgi:hypothetical protein
MNPTRSRFAIGLFVLVALAVAAWAAAMLNVTATINNYDPNNAGYTLQSDGTISAVYSSGSGVTSNISPNSGGGYYQWNLDLSSSSRSFVVTLTPVNGSPAGPFAQAAFNGVLHSRCFGTNSSTNVNWTTIQPGYPDSNCAMRVNFTYNGVAYTLVMSPDYPGTGTATVSCTRWSSKTKSCSSWTDVPTAGGANANVANLYAGSPGSQTNIGSYALSFNIGVTNP